MKSNKVINVSHSELGLLIECMDTMLIMLAESKDPRRVQKHGKASAISLLRNRLQRIFDQDSNILARANEIVNQRSEEKDRQYGNFHSSMQRTADLFNKIRDTDKLTGEDVYYIMICLKLSREGISHREDNLLDLVAYAGALNNYKENERD